MSVGGCGRGYACAWLRESSSTSACVRVLIFMFVDGWWGAGHFGSCCFVFSKAS